MFKIITRVLTDRNNLIAFAVSMILASLLILAHFKGIINLIN